MSPPLRLRAVLVAALTTHCAMAAPTILNQIADRLEATRPFSTPGCIAGSRDGRVVYISEGGSITIVEPANPAQPDIDGNLENPIARVPLGTSGPHPVRMILDPDADPFDKTRSLGDAGYANFLLIAAGRSGLWVMDAGPTSQYWLTRVDDSGPLHPTEQRNNRLCNDVAIVTLAGEEYVVATFARADSSHVRFYRLADVRSALADQITSPRSVPDETGHEIPALRIVRVRSHPFRRAPARSQFFRAYSTALAIDQDDDASPEADVYVAMLTDGVARFRIRAVDLQPTPPGGVPTGIVVEWGPLFGDGSFAARDTSVPRRELYDNFDWIDQAPDPDIVERSEPPQFLDIELHRDTPDGAGTRHGHLLYAAVEPLGLLVFDLDGPWGPSMPIHRHEGVVVEIDDGATEGFVNQGGWDETVVALNELPAVEGDAQLQLATALSYPRDIQLVDTSSGLFLLATVAGAPLIGDSPPIIEGFAYEDRFQYGAVSSSAPARGSRPGRTRVMRVADLSPSSGTAFPEPTLAPAIELLNGGAFLFAPTDQSNLFGSSVGQASVPRLEYFHSTKAEPDREFSGSSGATCMTSVRIDADSGGPDTLVATRERAFAPGFRVFGLGESLVDPRVIMTSDGDGVSREGSPALVASSAGGRVLAVDRDPNQPNGNDQRLSSGVIFGPRSLWIDPAHGPNQQLALGGGKQNPADRADQFELAVHTVLPAEAPGDAPPGIPNVAPRVFESSYFFDPPLDRWGTTGRAFFLGGMVDERYDAYVQSAFAPEFDGAEFYFLIQPGTPDGIHWGRRDALVDLLQNATPGSKLDAADVEATLRGRLNTHPEYDRFPFDPSDPGWSTEREVAVRWLEQRGGEQPHRDRLKTFFPQLVRVRDPGTLALTSWVLAAPCGVSVLDDVEPPDLDDFVVRGPGYQTLPEVYEEVVGSSGPTPSWFPPPGSVEHTSFDRGRVLFWDFTDPNGPPPVRGRPPGSSALPRIVLPLSSAETPEPKDVARSSFAWHLETTEITDDDSNRTLVFVGDFMGGVHCHEISDILMPGSNEPIHHASWYAPLGRLDVLVNNVRGIALDEKETEMRLYVAVQRIGVVVLRVVLQPGGAVDLVQETILDDLTEPLSLHLRVVEGTGERLLVVCDHRQGLRVYSSE